MKYKCSKCKQVYERDSDKAWIKSYCSNTGTDARLIKEKRMELNQMEQEAIVVEQLAWLLAYELKQESLDRELISGLMRVLMEFKPPNKEDNK
jgi:DNA-directed RNA polymerase subunit RPC12/RpoP